MNGPNRNQNNRPRPATNQHNRPQRKPNQGGGGGGPQGRGPSDRQDRPPDRNRGNAGQPGQQQSGQQQGGQRDGNRSRRGKRNRNRGGQSGQGQQGQQGQPGQQGQHRQGQKGGGQQRLQRPESKPIQLQPEFKEIPNKHEIKKYGVIFFDTLQAAKADLATLQQKASAYDQLNVVVRNEANMDDPDFNQIPKLKLFAGAAWATIHERRNEEGWYDAPR